MYKLVESAKPHFARPWGPVITGAEAVKRARGRFLVSVGDVVTETFLQAGLTPRVSIVDGLTQRVVRKSAANVLDPARGIRTRRVKNPAGVITEELWAAIAESLSSDKPVAIHVEGEEDLAAIPAALLAPEGALVAYGQPPVTSLGIAEGGVVLVEVTPETRAHAKELLSKMEVTR